MSDRLKQIFDKVKEWWNKFTTAQKGIIIAGISVVLCALIILIFVFTQPSYVTLVTAKSTTEASEIKKLLDDNSVKYTMSDDGMLFKVDEKEQAQARLLLGSNNIQASDYNINTVTEGSFSTTESDKSKKYVAYLEKKLSSDFAATFDAVKTARIELHIPQDNGTLIQQKVEATATVMLTLADKEKFTEDNAAYLAKATAAALGKKTTDNIVILDSEGNMLYSGEDSSAVGSASSQLGLKGKAEKSVVSSVRGVILGTKLYDEVQVAPNLVMDFSTKKSTVHKYAPWEDDQTQGVLSHKDTYNSESNSGEGAAPGTDANNETTYVTQDNQTTSTTVEENSEDYLPNEEISTTETPAGVIDYETSSIAVSAINFVVVNEEDYKAADHENMTWEEYKVANSAPVDVTENDANTATTTRLTNLVQTATGIPTEKISVALYDQNVYFDKAGSDISVTDILQIVLILAILALLAFVILRSLKTERQQQVEEEPEELSVEALLESKPVEEDEALENIEMDEGSETKKLIELFVEQNPEAAANLLRNWLNEDYM